MSFLNFFEFPIPGPITIEVGFFVNLLFKFAIKLLSSKVLPSFLLGISIIIASGTLFFKTDDIHSGTQMLTSPHPDLYAESPAIVTAPGIFLEPPITKRCP